MNLLRMVGGATQSKMAKRLRGGPSSLLPLSPTRGSGVPASKGLTPAKPNDFQGRQNPRFTSSRGGVGVPKPTKNAGIVSGLGGRGAAGLGASPLAGANFFKRRTR